jgi:hypothetical protein
MLFSVFLLYMFLRDFTLFLDGIGIMFLEEAIACQLFKNLPIF